MSIELAALHVFPVKACRGLAPRRHAVDRFGLALDRAFAIVDAEGGVLTQRELPQLATIDVGLTEDALTLTTQGASPLAIPLAAGPRKRIPVRVWRHAGDGLDQGDAAAAWLEAFLGRPARLVRTPPDHARRVNPARFAGEAHTSFTDGYPFLLLGEASLADLNARLPAPVAIERFRPSLVLRGAPAYAEDGWRRVRIGALELALVKPCPRCIVTNVDPARGERAGNEPLFTLARFRRGEEGPAFGVYAVAIGTGALAVGMPLEVLEVPA